MAIAGAVWRSIYLGKPEKMATTRDFLGHRRCRHGTFGME
jgi:hypothetical protein